MATGIYGTKCLLLEKMYWTERLRRETHLAGAVWIGDRQEYPFGSAGTRQPPAPRLICVQVHCIINSSSPGSISVRHFARLKSEGRPGGGVAECRYTHSASSAIAPGLAVAESAGIRLDSADSANSAGRISASKSPSDANRTIPSTTLTNPLSTRT